jgi:hypothetical protein
LLKILEVLVANPSPEVIAWIQGQNPNWGEDDAEIAAALNQVMEENPAPAPGVLSALSAKDLFDSVGSTSKKNLANWINLGKVLDDIRNGNRTATINWIEVMVAGEVVTLEEGMSVITYLTTETPDPDHPAQIPAANIRFGRLLDASDVEAARG